MQGLGLPTRVRKPDAPELEIDDVTEPSGVQLLLCPVCAGFGRMPRSGSQGRPRLCRHCGGAKHVLARPGEKQHDDRTCDCRFNTDPKRSR